MRLGAEQPIIQMNQTATSGWAILALTVLFFLLFLLRIRRSDVHTQKLDQALIHLARALIALIEDYTLKLARLLFNLVHFPVGVEFRDFKFTFYYYTSSKGGGLKQEKEEINRAYIEYKSSYLLIAGLCYIVPLAVYSNTKYALTLFMADPSRANITAFLIGIAVFFADVAIIRISIRQSGLSFWKQLPGGIFRGTIVLCTSIILGLAVLPSMFPEELDAKLRSREKQKILASPYIEKYERDRVMLLGKLHELYQSNFCAGFAFSGGGRDELYVGPSQNDLAKRFPAFKSEEAAQTPQPPTATTSLQPCRSMISKDEPKCSAPRPLQRSPCTTAYRESIKVLANASIIVGSTRSLAEFNPAGFVSLKSVGLPEVAYDDSDYGKLEAQRRLIADELAAAASLRASPAVPQVQSAASAPSGGTLARIVGKTQDFFAPLPAVTGNSARLGLNEAADVLLDKLFLRPGQYGGLLAWAILVILAVFEFLIVLLKWIGDYNTISRRNNRLDRAYQNYLLTGRQSPILVSKTRMRDDWGLVEHLHEVSEAAVEFMNALAPGSIRLRLAVLLLLSVFAVLLVDFMSCPWWLPTC